MRTLERLRSAAGKPPGYIARRAWREIRRVVRSGLVRRRIRTLTADEMARMAGAASLPDFWRRQVESGLLYSAADRQELRQLYREEYRAGAVALQARVLDDILAHRFDLLGSGPTCLGDEIDWHLDFKSGRRWELAPSHRIDYAELDRPSDVKIPWELSRGHHFVTLGQDWLLHRNPEAAAEFQRQVISWIRANPPGLGINWACTMEVGLRAVNWIYALALFSDAPFPDDFLESILVALYRHGLWIPENLEIAHVNGNHFIANALGLAACGFLFRPVPEARGWMKTGFEILEREIRLQVDEDGVDIEASVPYHRLVMEIFLTGLQIMRAAGIEPSQGYLDKLERMTAFVAAYTLPDGSSPVVGDADDGRVLRFADRPLRDHRYLISMGCALFGRAEWKERAGEFAEDSLWLLGPEGRSRFDSLRPEEAPASQAFPESGFHILRSAESYLFIDAGPVGFRGLGGHGHNDCLSFEWHALGQPLLTDSGLYVYTASPEWRDRFRSTMFHNTIRVDGEEINRFLTPPTLWFLGNDAQPIDVKYTRSGGRETLTAGHTGYRRLPDPVTVFRSFETDCQGPTLRLLDRLDGREDHLVEFFFHAAPGAQLREMSSAGLKIGWVNGIELDIGCESRRQPEWKVRDGWYAPSYGVRIGRPAFVASMRTRLPFETAWTLSVRRCPVGAGREMEKA